MHTEGYIQLHELPDSSTLLVKIHNNFDFRIQKSFMDIFKNKEYPAYVIDLTEAAYIDSIALGMLLLLHRRACKECGTIRVVGCSETVLHSLRTAHFDRFFDIEGLSDVASA